MADAAKKLTPEEVKELVKNEILPVLKTEVAPVVKDIVEERVNKALEEAKKATSGGIRGVVDGGAIAKDALGREPLAVRQAKAGRYMLALLVSRGDKAVAEKISKSIDTPDGWVSKAVGESTLSAGGFMAPAAIGEFIDSLGAGTIVRQLGARTVPMTTGQLSMARGDSGATMNWVGENQVAGSSQPAGGNVNLTLRKGIVIVPMSNDMLRDVGQATQDWVEREARRAYERGEDLAFLRGRGSENSPMGMLYQVAAANKFNITHAGATATVQEIWTDLGKLILKLANGNVPMVRCGWGFSKRSEWYLKTLLNANAIPVFAEMTTAKTLFGFPFGSTTQIPNNLNTSGAGTNDESEVYLGDFESLVIGQEGEVEVDVIKGAAYYDSATGAVVSGVSQDQTTLVLKRRVDFRSLYGGADIAVATSVDWGTGL